MLVLMVECIGLVIYILGFLVRSANLFVWMVDIGTGLSGRYGVEETVDCSCSGNDDDDFFI